ncbi:MAG TPA: hypothetical protein VNQ77_09545 [Frankiaceae bacterium]|nr:hypothetical protein [Frankiaceae bacterium]
MTAEVLASGEERPPRRPLSVVIGVAAVAALVAYGLAASRSPEPEARPTPTPFTEYPSESPVPRGPRRNPFTKFVRVPVPPAGEVRGVLLAEGVPGFVVGQGNGAAYALHAVGGPLNDQVLLGWCAASGTFEDEAGTYRYRRDGGVVESGMGLERPPVRPDPFNPGHVEIGVTDGPTDGEVERADGTRCPGGVRLPPLPPAVRDVHDAAGAYFRVRGRYVVSTERTAFCEAVRETGCADQGWERYGPGSEWTLRPDDLVGSYTWEGRFLVRTDLGGGISVIRLGDSRLVRRESVGVETRIGVPVATYSRDGVLHLRFNPFQHASGTPKDDSPSGPPPVVLDEWATVMEDVRGGIRDYVVRRDAEIVLGFGVTGVGAPAQTGQTLGRWVRAQRRRAVPEPLWLILDAQGRILRVAIGP